MYQYEKLLSSPLFNLSKKPWEKEYYYDFGTGKKIEVPKEKPLQNTTTAQKTKSTAEILQDAAFNEGFNYYEPKKETAPAIKKDMWLPLSSSKTDDGDYFSFEADDDSSLFSKYNEKSESRQNLKYLSRISQVGSFTDEFLDGFNFDRPQEKVYIAEDWDKKREDKARKKETASKILDATSAALTAASFIPGADTVTNLLQIPVDLLRGDYLGAGLDLIGAIPFIGEIADGAKVLSKADEITDSIRYGQKRADLFDGGSINKQLNKTPRNNRAQNAQTNAVARLLGLSEKQQRELHKEVSGMGWGYQEILEHAKAIFSK